MRRICESLNKFSKFSWKFWQFYENFNKNLEKFDETLNFLLLSILIASEAWAVLHHLQIFRGFGGSGSFPLSPGDVTGINIYFYHWFILFFILLIETKFDHIFLKFLLKLVYSFKFSIVKYEQCVPRWMFFHSTPMLNWYPNQTPFTAFYVLTNHLITNH